MDSKEGQQTFLIFIAVLSFIYLIVNLIKCCTKNRNRVRNRPEPRRPPELPQVRKKQFIKHIKITIHMLNLIMETLIITHAIAMMMLIDKNF